mmetsp:Transcript_112838/g.324276  ORF Transcript_112838/g.324276 Transcript_112838/m.324276 type:complete len:427 (+) Transcript_112838:74-1354(+)
MGGGGVAICTWPLDVLRACLSFWPLRQLIEAEALSKRWQEAAADAALWAALEVSASQLYALPVLLGRGRAGRVRRLALASRQPRAPEALMEAVSACTLLTELYLRGVRGPEPGPPRPVASVRMPLLKVLMLEYSPYFVLRWYSHNTGARNAAVCGEWLVQTFPSLETLTCDYLQLDRQPTIAGSLGEAAVQELPPAGGAVLPALRGLRRLSFVAVVRNDGEEVGSWNSATCCLNLAALASFAPALECLEIRCPRLNLGRVSRRPGQSTEDLVWMCRRFCATNLPQLRGICTILPGLRELSIATLKEGVNEALTAHGGCLATFLGIFPTAPAAIFEAPRSSAICQRGPHTGPAATVGVDAVGGPGGPSAPASLSARTCRTDGFRPLRIRVGMCSVGSRGSPASAAAALRDAASRCAGRVSVELSDRE